MAAHDEEKGVASRYLLSDLPPTLTEDEMRDYFGSYGEIEDVTMKPLDAGRLTGSVKFFNPTVELRNQMLGKAHQIQGMTITIQTWKMQKMGRPGFSKAKTTRAADFAQWYPQYGYDGMGYDGMGYDGMAYDGMAYDGMGKGGKYGMAAYGAAPKGGPLGAKAGGRSGPYDDGYHSADYGGYPATEGKASAWKGARGKGGQYGYDAHAGAGVGGKGGQYGHGAQAAGGGGGKASQYGHGAQAAAGGGGKAGQYGCGANAGKGSQHAFGAQAGAGMWKPSFSQTPTGYGGCDPADVYGSDCDAAWDEMWPEGYGCYPAGPIAGAAAGCGKGTAKPAGKTEVYEEKDITARYLLAELPEECQESDLHDYFSTFGDIEVVNLKRVDSGKVTGSVKFLNPTIELRNIMLREAHEILGQPLIVETWKMRKNARPGGFQPKTGKAGGADAADWGEGAAPCAGFGPMRGPGGGACYHPYGKGGW